MLAVAVIVMVFYRAWITAGLVTAGDFPATSRAHLLDALPFPSLWDASLSTGGPTITQATMFPLALLQGVLASWHLDWPVSERLLWIFPAVAVPCASTYALALTLFRRHYSALVSALAVVMNSYIYLLYQGGQFGVAVGSGCMPLVLWAYLRGQRRGDVRDYALTGLAMSLQAIYDIRSTYIMMGVLLLYGILSCAELVTRGRPLSVRTVMRASGLPHIAVALLVLASLHLWWILPILFVHGPTLPSGYTDVAGVSALSYMKISNGLALFHPFWFTNNLQLHAINPLFFMAPLLVFALLLRHQLGKDVLFLVTLALLAIFLVKGTNSPIGGVYDWLFTHVPAFAYYRDASKFYQPLVLAYALLLGVSTSTCRRIICGTGAWRRIADSGVMAIFILIAAFPAYPALLQEAGGTLAVSEVPADYVRFNDFIDRQRDFFRVLWAPARPRFATYSSLHPALDAGQISVCCSATSSPPQRPWLWLGSSSASRILASLAVRYIVVPSQIGNDDIIGEPWPTGDRAVPSSAILETIRTMLPEFHEFSIGRLEVFASPASTPLAFTASATGRASRYAGCASGLPCFTTLRGAKHVALRAQPSAVAVQLPGSGQSWNDLRVNVAHAPVYLVFAQTYDPDWLAFVEPAEAAISQWTTLWQHPLPASDHVVAYGYANAWLLRQPGAYQIVLQYWPQRLVLLGGTLSALFLLCYLSLLLRRVPTRRPADFAYAAMGDPACR